MTILSYNLCIEAGQNLIWNKRAKEEQHAAFLRDAQAVILPQGCSEKLYALSSNNCSSVFPNYHARFQYPGKTGQAELFQELEVPHPQTKVYKDLNEWAAKGGRDLCTFPSVFKLSWGGEGSNVALLQKDSDLDHWLNNAAASEQNGQKGFLIQQYIPTGGKSLRVVVIGERYYSYWRIAPDNNEEGQQGISERFYSNLAKGAAVDRNFMPERQEAAVQVLHSFCQHTHINLAGVDFIFSEEETEPEPLFLEINYCFRCKGIGGHDKYVEHLTDAIREWLKIQRIV